LVLDKKPTSEHRSVHKIHEERSEEGDAV